MPCRPDDRQLSELAFKYYFTIPSYYILVMRAFVTLEGIALSADDDESFNSACSFPASLTPRLRLCAAVSSRRTWRYHHARGVHGEPHVPRTPSCGRAPSERSHFSVRAYRLLRAVYEATAPYARRKLLTPRTAGGRALLRAALFSSTGRKALRTGIRLPRPVRWLGAPFRWAFAPVRWLGRAVS